MSVINNVLKELDNKPSSFTPLASTGIVIESPQQDKNSFIWIAIFILFIMILLTGYIVNTGLLGFTGENVSDLIEDISAPAQSMTVAPLAAPDLPAFRNDNFEITGLQINETAEYMELVFQLQHRAQIYLKARSGNQYVFHFKNARSGIRTPQLGTNPWLDNIILNKVENGLEIEFETRQGVMVETANLHKQQQDFWSIKLKKSLSRKMNKTNTMVLDKVQLNGQKQEHKEAQIEVDGRVSADNNKKPVPIKLDIKSTTKKTTQLQLFDEAISLLNSGQTSRAGRLLKKLIGSEYDRQVRLYLMQLLKQEQQKQQLEQLILESQKLYPSDSAFKLFHANELFANKRYLDLIKLYRLEADSINLVNLLAASYQRTNQHERAIQHYLQAIKIDSQQSKLWISLGISQQQLGQKAAALSSYQSALSSGLNNERLKAFLQQRIRQLSEK